MRDAGLGKKALFTDEQAMLIFRALAAPYAMMSSRIF